MHKDGLYAAHKMPQVFFNPIRASLEARTKISQL